MTDNEASSSTLATSNTTTTASTLWSSFLWPLLYRGSQLLLGVVVVVGGLLYVHQESLLYFPTVAGLPRHNRENPRGYRHPGERGLQDYSEHDIEIPSDPHGIKIHAWFIPHPAAATASSKKLPTILFFHGNAGNIGLRLPNALGMIKNVPANFMLVEYRGYGDSSCNSASAGKDKPTEAGLKQDAVAAWEYVQTCVALQPYVDPRRIFVMGRSLGGAVAVTLAATAAQRGQPLAGVILENTFTSISDMVDVVLSPLKYIKSFVLRISWNSLQIFESGQLATTPTLFLAGDADTLVPHEHMQRLYVAAGKHAGHTNVKWHVIRGGTHNESWMQGGQAYWQAIASFMAGHASSASSCLSDNDAAAAGNDINGGGAASIPLMSQSLTGMAKDAWSNNKKDKNN